MLAYHSMIVDPAIKAGINVPPDPENYNPEEYFHWHVFCLVQLGTSLPYWTAHWDNAKFIASFSEEELKLLTIGQLIEQGLAV